MATDSSAIDVRERELFGAHLRPAEDARVPQLSTQNSPAASPWSAVTKRVTLVMRDARACAVMEYERGIASLLVPVAMGSGALAYFAAAAEPALMSLVIWIVLLGLAGLATRRIPVLKLLFFGAALAAGGATLGKLEVLRANTKVIGGEISTRLTGYIRDIDYLANGRVRLLIDVVQTDRPTLKYQPDRVSVSASKLPRGATAGAFITGPVRLSPPPGAVRPGGYDYSFQSYFRGIGANGFFLGVPQLAIAPVEQSIERRFMALIDNFRNETAARIRHTIGGSEGEIAAALIVGVRAGIPESVNESLRRTGLAHILSISGLHMALVAGIVMAAVRFGFALSPRVSSLYPAKKYAAASALAVVGAYLLVSGGDVAAQRSFIMLAVMLLATLMDRRALSMRNLAIAAVVVLAISPHEIVGPSFQMSFAATAALIGGYALWVPWRNRNGAQGAQHRHVPILKRSAKAAISLLIGTIVTAIVAGLATAIFGAWHFQRVSPLSLFANLATSPVVSLIVMPFAVLSAIAMPLGLDGPFLFVMGKGISAMLWVSDWLSQRSPLDTVGLISVNAVAWFTVALLISTMTSTRLRWAALVCTAGGLLSLGGVNAPDVFISEDARLVAVDDGRGRLLINGGKPNSFTLDGWKRALKTEEVVMPVRVKTNETERPNRDVDPRQNNNHIPQQTVGMLLAKVSPQHFLCANSLCLVEHASGSIIAVLESQSIPSEICAVADLIVVQSPTIEHDCKNGMARIVDAKTLARRGAAAVSFSHSTQRNMDLATVEYAVGTIYRPWHSHRAFSRAARGLQPYNRAKNTRPANTSIGRSRSHNAQ